ncbi:hypothetical protein ACTXT7_013080 [Hymenolepis weldensis]
MENTICDKIENAARAASAYDFICSVHQMYNTGIGESGVSLFVGCTLIAHCLTTVRNADRMIVMHRGREEDNLEPKSESNEEVTISLAQLVSVVV